MVVPLEGQPPVSTGNRQPRAWIPLPFRAYFWVPLVLFLLLAAIGLEVALRISNKNQGFPMGKTPRDDQILHYAYVSTLIRGLIALLTVALIDLTSCYYHGCGSSTRADSCSLFPLLTVT